VNFCSRNDLGRGPVIHQSTNYDANKWHVLNKRTLNEPFQHISLLVKREALDVDRLGQHFQAEQYPLVEWVPEAAAECKKKIAMILDGHHRQEMAYSRGQKFMAHWLRADARFLEEAKMAYYGITPTSSYTLPVDIKRRALRKYGDLRCTIYDWGEVCCFDQYDTL
jgi:hypothetical protein